jgi:hypothetical protein
MATRATISPPAGPRRLDARRSRHVLTESRPEDAAAGDLEISNVVVVIPIPNDPDWSIFSELSEDVPIIVCDDSNGKLSPAPRKNVRFFDYPAQEAVMGKNWSAIPHKSAASRNFGHYLAWKEGYDVIVALDYDCRTRTGWLGQHLEALGRVDGAPATRPLTPGGWVNSVEQPGFYARGYPYEFRNPAASAVEEVVASGVVKLNMGVWDNILDLNGIDKIQKEPPYDPGLRGDTNFVALGNIPVCGMNTAFTRDLTPAYFFLPDIWIGDWQLSRHDDIWGGYIVKRLMDKRGDLFRYGKPIVEHTKQTNMNRVVMLEHYMHLMAREFYELVEWALEPVKAGDYSEMYGHFVDEYMRGLDRSKAPAHYVQGYRELGESMQRWDACFR